jgi:enoyl-CoA hydratase/carnithine racemase
MSSWAKSSLGLIGGPRREVMSEKDLFTVEREEHVVWLTLNRPEKRNAMTFEFFDGLLSHFTAFDQDPKVRVVLIKAAGESFTAGIDLSALGSQLQGEGADFREELRKKILQIQEGMTAVERCRKPVIAAVHSHCIGGGVDLLSACDIRMASRDAVFSIRETRIAIVADLGTLQRLPYIIGHGWFRELALTGRNFTAEEAHKMGFITHLCADRQSLYAEAKRVAKEIVECSPLAVQGAKEVINYSRDHGVHAGLEYVAQKNAAILPSEDLMEAFKSFVEKRPAHFKGK